MRWRIRPVVLLLWRSLWTVVMQSWKPRSMCVTHGQFSTGPQLDLPGASNCAGADKSRSESCRPKLSTEKGAVWSVTYQYTVYYSWLLLRFRELLCSYYSFQSLLKAAKCAYSVGSCPLAILRPRLLTPAPPLIRSTAPLSPLPLSTNT